jgi:hypothetical protein
MELVPIDLHISTNSHIGWDKECSIFINILILPPLQELAVHDTRILLRWLKDRYSIISQEELDNEFPINILRDACVEASSITKNLLVIVNVFEEVSLRFVWEELEYVAEGVDLVTKSIVWRNNQWLRFAWLWELNTTQLKVLPKLGLHILLSELIHTRYSEFSPVGIDNSTGLDLITSQVVITDVVLTWLVHGEAIGELLSSQ